MSNPSPSQNGKGSARRREDLSKIRDNWDQIDWSKGRPAAKRLIEIMSEPTGRILSEEYGAKTEWAIPSVEELLNKRS